MNRSLSQHLTCGLFVILAILAQGCGHSEPAEVPAGDQSAPQAQAEQEPAQAEQEQAPPEQQAQSEEAPLVSDAPETAGHTNTSPQEASDDYRQITGDDDLYCGLRVAEVTYEFDSPLDGELVSFACLNQADEEVQIELAKTAIKEGEFTTADFGVMRAEMAGSGFSGISYTTGKQSIKAFQEEGQLLTRLRFYMKPSQIQKLRTHLGR